MILIAHLTDPHLGLVDQTGASGLDPVRSWQRALQHVAGLQPKPQVLMVTGDLTDAGQLADYVQLRQLVQDTLPAPQAGGPRVLMVPGNHDRPAVARQVLGDWMPAEPMLDHASFHTEHAGLQFIGLDTTVAGHPGGALDEARLDWLAARLAACPGQPVVLLMHHPPLITGMPIMDVCGLLRGRKRLAELVASHGAVQLIACGHMHRPIVGVLGGAQVCVMSSVSHQLALDLQPGAGLACVLEPPMLGLYRWAPEHGMVCHFGHIQRFPGPFPI